MPTPNLIKGDMILSKLPAPDPKSNTFLFIKFFFGINDKYLIVSSKCL